MLLFSSGYSMDMTSCRKIGQMNNNINNMPLYSMGVYMCLELPGQQNTVTPSPNLLDFSETRNNNNIKNLSNTTILNSENHTHFINSTKNIESWNNSSNIIKNSTNITLTTTTNMSYTPSPTTKPISVPTTPSLTTTPSATTTPSTTTSSTTTSSTTTPEPTTVKPTTLSPSTNKPPDPTTNSPTPSPVTRQEPIIPTKNLPPNINNTKNSKNFDNNPSPSIKLEDNPLLPIVIILLSVLVLAFCGVCCKWLYNKRKLKKINCNKSDKKEEPDIESGEKKNRNSWSFAHTNFAKEKLRAMEQFKKAGNRATKKKALKPKLARTQEQQQSIPNRAPPNPKVAANKLRTLNNKNKKNVRDTLLEQSKTIPHGTKNPTLQKMLNRLEPHDEGEDGKKWYKETFQAELDHIDVINNRPLTPPPPLPVPTFNQQSQPPIRKVYGNSQNKNSPKMIVREIVNPESPNEN